MIFVNGFQDEITVSGTIKELKEQMECAEIPYYKELVKSIINNL